MAVNFVGGGVEDMPSITLQMFVLETPNLFSFIYVTKSLFKSGLR